MENDSEQSNSTKMRQNHSDKNSKFVQLLEIQS